VSDEAQRVLAAVDPVWRSFYEIAARLAMERFVVRRALDDLVAAGLIESRKNDTEYRVTGVL
jgi:DNA-binding IclR family transcriptional regulator